MPDQYRRDSGRESEGSRDIERRAERGDDRPRGGDWRGGSGRWRRPEADDRGYATSDRGGISRETGFDRGASRDERNSRDWQQRVSEDDQGYRSQDRETDREWQGEPDWQSDRPRGWQAGRDWSQGSSRSQEQGRGSEEPWHRSHEQWRGSHEYGLRDRGASDRGRDPERPWNDERSRWRDLPHDSQGGREREQERFGTGGSRERDQDWGRERWGEREAGARGYEGRRYGGWNEGFGGETWQSRGDQTDRAAMNSPWAQHDERWPDERGREGGRGPGGGWPWGSSGGPMATWGIGRSESPRIGGTREGAWPSYAGRGPKGYRRSDDRIREEVSDRLMDDHRVDASDITVEVNDGEVTLTGTVPDREQRRCAEELVERVNGVKEVNVNLRVNRQAGGQPWQTASSQASQHATQAGQPAQPGQQGSSPASARRETPGNADRTQGTNS